MLISLAQNLTSLGNRVIANVMDEHEMIKKLGEQSLKKDVGSEICTWG